MGKVLIMYIVFTKHILQVYMYYVIVLMIHVHSISFIKVQEKSSVMTDVS